MKRFKAKRKTNKISLVKIIISAIIFLLLFIYISLHNLSNSNSSLIHYLLKGFNNDRQFNVSIMNKLTFNLDYFLHTPSFLSNEKIIYTEYNPLVYIYNTHDTEEYSDKKKVLDAGYALSNNLKKLGINSLVEERLPSKLSNTGLSLYDISKSLIIDSKKHHTSIEYFIDIHRDSVKNTTITINNKRYAKILFVLGLDNPNYEENKIVLEQFNKYLTLNYPGLSKGILEKSGKDVNGSYNQDIDKNVLLIEIGGIENNFEEVNNSTEIIALMLYNMLGDKGEKVS